MSDHAERAGESVLGVLLAFYTPEAVTMVQAAGVTFEDFKAISDRQHIIYRAVLALHREGVHVDDLTVAAFLSRHGTLERAGGPGYLAVCASSASPGALRDHAALVAQGARERRLRVKAFALAEMVERGEDPAVIAEMYVALGREITLPAPRLRVVKDEAA
jgi:replicative DNA helicase